MLITATVSVALKRASIVELLFEVLSKTTVSAATGTVSPLQLAGQLQLVLAPQPPSHVLVAAWAGNGKLNQVVPSTKNIKATDILCLIL